MTKKDYMLIAKVFRVTVDIWKNARRKWRDSDRPEKEGRIADINKIISSIEVIVKGLCHELTVDNPRFDKEKFIKACGI
jgi:hypothetical protein